MRWELWAAGVAVLILIIQFSVEWKAGNYVSQEKTRKGKSNRYH